MSEANAKTYDLRVCFEAYGLNWDSEGNPVPVGLEITIPGAKKMIPYEQLTQNIDLTAVIAAIGMDGIICPNDLRIITPEEYDKEYG